MSIAGGCPPARPLSAAPERPPRPVPVRRSRVEELTASAGGLRVLFQPVYELSRTRRSIHAVECLVRGPRGTRLEEPERLFAFFLDAGDGVDLARSCLETSMRASGRLPYDVFVNVSPALVLSPGFVSSVVATSERLALPLRRLILDVAVPLDAGEPARLASPLRDLRRLGVRVCLDEEGPFASPLDLLLEVRPAYVKLSRGVVRGLSGDASSRACVEATASLGARIGFRVVAEGVETATDARAVEGCGLDLAQGFHLAPPLERAELLSRPSVEGDGEAWGQLYAR